MSRRRVSDQRRTEILEAAAGVIAERGLCDTRIADVAERIGASPALILYYFDTKDALLTATLSHRDEQFFATLSKLLDEAPTARDRLRALIDYSCPPEESLGRDDNEWELWLDMWTRARHDPGVAEMRAAMDKAMRDVIADVVTAGISAGEFRRTDAHRFALMLSAMIDGLAIQVLLGDHDVTRKDMLELCLDVAERELLVGGHT
jgi:AcrR family transcriptional regulator